MRYFSVIISALVTLLVFYWLFSYVSLKDITLALKAIKPYYLFLFIISSLLMSALRAFRYQAIINSLKGKSSFGAIFLVVLLRNFTSDLLPARFGTLAYIPLAVRYINISYKTATASFFISLAFDLITFVFIGAVLFSVNFKYLFNIINTHFFYALLLIALTALLVIVFFIKKRLLLRFKKILRIFSLTDFIYYICLSIGIRALKYLALYFYLQGVLFYFNFKLPFFHSILAIAVAEGVASLPISGIGGFGAYEGAFALVLRNLGMPMELSANVSITHHLFTQIYGAILALIAVLILNLKYRRY